MIDVDTITVDIARCKDRIRALQNETVHCITVLPTGKIKIADQARLEAINAEINRLGELADHNSEVAHRLQAVLEKVNLASIFALKHAKTQSEKGIADSKIGINRCCGTWLKESPNYTVENIRTHPRVAPEVDRCEDRIKREEANLKRFIPTLEEAQSILKDFLPSGLPGEGQKNEFNQAISRATAL